MSSITNHKLPKSVCLENVCSIAHYIMMSQTKLTVVAHTHTHMRVCVYIYVYIYIYIYAVYNEYITFNKNYDSAAFNNVT